MQYVVLYGFYGVWTAFSLFVLIRLSFAFRHFRLKQRVKATSMINDLPSVSVCIPARNETHAMTECLEKVVASTYPKLEVIVLDDSSGDDTSVLIKSFAHAGVRFVDGSPLPAGWLGKNHALQELVKEASGTYILFMDVDTRIQPDTIEQLVAYIQQEQALMISVLPRREDGWRASVVFSPLRYFWELVFHRRATPATASSAWMIHRRTLLDEFQGLIPYKLAIQPEARLAATLMAKDRYRFLIGTQQLGVGYEKKWSSQLATSVRLLLPLLGGHLGTGLLAIAGLVTAILPLAAVIAGLWADLPFVWLIGAWQLLVYMILYALYTTKVWHRGWWIGALLVPFILVQELVLLIASMIQYARRRVHWKGRPIKADPVKVAP